VDLTFRAAAERIKGVSDAELIYEPVQVSCKRRKVDASVGGLVGAGRGCMGEIGNLRDAGVNLLSGALLLRCGRGNLRNRISAQDWRRRRYRRSFEKFWAVLERDDPEKTAT
jgi:hypothetical protein